MKNTAEDRDAAGLAERLAAELTSAGQLSTEVWRRAFETVPRHLFVPQAAIAHTIPGESTRYRLLADSRDPAKRAAWLEAVYSDTTLVTQIDGRPVADVLARAGPSGTGWPTSSSTAPGLMAWMLEAVDLRDGDRVLEVGTGTGYNAALLCERLGDHNVTSIDIDPRLTAVAQDRLAALGHHPVLAAADGRDGYPRRAPYDRIIATTAWPYLPPAWLSQTKPGGLILTNITGLLGGAMLLATVHGDATAVGRFHPRWAGFMAAQGSVRKMSDITPADTADGCYDVGVTRLDPGQLSGAALAFAVQLHTGDARPYWATSGHQPLYGLLSQDGSWAEVYPPDERGERRVEQGGPRRLWTLAENAHTFWQANGRPDWSRYGLTATPEHQWVWFARPDGPRWQLPVPPPGPTRRPADSAKETARGAGSGNPGAAVQHPERSGCPAWTQR